MPATNILFVRSKQIYSLVFNFIKKHTNSSLIAQYSVSPFMMLIMKTLATKESFSIMHILFIHTAFFCSVLFKQLFIIWACLQDKCQKLRLKLETRKY